MNFDLLKLKLKTKIEPIVDIIDIKIGNENNLYICDLISILDNPSLL